MSLGHVYIVLEPVGSTRLKFSDDRYYEFICFDVPKVVWSPGYDHGHDEESRNGRDIKIDRYIGSLHLDIGRVPGKIRILPEYQRGYRNPPEANGPCWAIREREGRGGTAPLS